MNTTDSDMKIAECLNLGPKDFALLRSRITTSDFQDKELLIREENLKLIDSGCKQFGIPCWLQGKTLQWVVQKGSLLVDDHDDDLGVPAEYYRAVCLQLYPALRACGFLAIRQEPEMISLLREGRYVDICFFSEREEMAGYGSKWFPRKHFQKLENIEFAGSVFKIPTEVNDLLKIMYPYEQNSSVDYKSENKVSRLKIIKKKKKRFCRRIKELLLTKTVVRPLPYEEFLTMRVEADNSINWVLRKPHLDILTDGGRLRTVGAIIDYLGTGCRLEKLRRYSIMETPTEKVFSEPLNLNENFWKNGNNFFFYCVYYGFRKGVIPYELVNKYIVEDKPPMLYSASYYEGLEIMSDKEISNLLSQSLIVCDKGAVVHGKHRVYAMIGRILSGKQYLHFMVEERVRRV